jgi:hypothetical protein
MPLRGYILNSEQQISKRKGNLPKYGRRRDGTVPVNEFLSKWSSSVEQSDRAAASWYFECLFKQHHFRQVKEEKTYLAPSEEKVPMVSCLYGRYPRVRVSLLFQMKAKKKLGSRTSRSKKKKGQTYLVLWAILILRADLLSPLPIGRQQETLENVKKANVRWCW